MTTLVILISSTVAISEPASDGVQAAGDEWGAQHVLLLCHVVTHVGSAAILVCKEMDMSANELHNYKKHCTVLQSAYNITRILLHSKVFKCPSSGTSNKGGTN